MWGRVGLGGVGLGWVGWGLVYLVVEVPEESPGTGSAHHVEVLVVHGVAPRTGEVGKLLVRVLKERNCVSFTVVLKLPK